MSNIFKTIVNRSLGAGLPPEPEIEQFGSDGEEVIYRMLCENFDSVIRNVVVPHKKLYLEKDFLVTVKNVPFVIEVKNWKGEIGAEGDKFYQNKPNGVRKTLKSPVGTTNQFVRCMKEFYQIERPVFGVTVFAEPDCTLSLPEEMDGVALLPAKKLLPYLRAKARLAADKNQEPVDPDRLLRCTRFYSLDREFTKGILADHYLECTAEDGARVRLDTLKLRYITVEHQLLRDKLYVTFANGTSGIFYQKDINLNIACLDGSWRTVALNRLRHIVF